MADTSKLLLLGGAGALLYFWLKGSSTSAPAPAPAGGTSAPPPPATATPPAPAQSAYNSLAAIYLRLTAQVQANSNDPALKQQQGQFYATPDVFDYYLSQVSQYQLGSSGLAAVFPGVSTPITLPAFWGPTSNYLAQTKGLSGLGLFQGLAGYGRGRR